MDFVRPTGAWADAKELEYLSALHQTEADHVRENATVSSLDIVYFLRSRYNMNFTHSQALNIVRGLSSDAYHRDRDGVDEAAQGDVTPKNNDEVPSTKKDDQGSTANGNQDHSMVKTDDNGEDNGEDESDGMIEEYLDLVQIVSILLIPSFARIAAGGTSRHQHAANATQDKKVDDLRLKDAVREFIVKSKQGAAEAPPTPDILENALSSMLSDLPEEQHDISEELVEYLLRKFGEYERAEDKQLIRTMTDLAKTPSSTTLTEEALLISSTSDLGPWDVESERRLSSFYYDVFGDNDPDKLKGLEKTDKTKDEEVPADEGDPTIEPWKVTDREFANVDPLTDSHSSLFIVVLIWFFFFGTMLIYGAEVLDSVQEIGEQCTLDDLACTFFNSVISWAIIGLLFSSFGILQVIPLSIGNEPLNRSASRKILAALVALFFSLVPYLILTAVDDGVSRPGKKTVPGNVSLPDVKPIRSEFSNKDLYENFQQAGKVICLSFGLFLAFLFVAYAAFCASESLTQQIQAVVPSELFASHAVRGYTSMKRAANFKLTKLLINAHILHSDDASKFFKKEEEMAEKAKKQQDTAMKNFVLYGRQNENAGGFLWTWRRLLSRSLFEEEGLWIHSRLYVIQFGQIVFSGLFVGILIAQIPFFARDAQRAHDTLPDGVPQWVVDFVPKSWMVRASMYPAVTSAAAVCIALILFYIPSTVSTILKYRSQIKPSLGEPSFLKFRRAMDGTHRNLANAVYGLLAAAGLWYVVVFAVVFIFVWPITRDGALWLTAWLLGLCVTIALKVVLTRLCRTAQYRAFFRIRPRGARLASLAFETWFIGLGGGVLLTRLGQFIGGAFFWIGRTDVFFLTEDVALFGVQLDLVPADYIKDILAHEAHRHPYKERLAQMYVMKARHRDLFVTEAGGAWRQLILLAFMPWLAKYRVFGTERREQALEAFRKRNKIKKKEGEEEDDGKGEQLRSGGVS